MKIKKKHQNLYKMAEKYIPKIQFFYRNNDIDLKNIYTKSCHLNSLCKAKINKIKKQKDSEINQLWPNAK